MVEFEYEELENATDNFNAIRLIGKGSHGWVYKANFKDDNRLVAIKKPSHDNSKLQNEIRVFSSLRENPHILSLLGTSQDSFNNKLLVMEFMPNGSLHDCLHVTKTPPGWRKRVEIAMQIARAVQFLHEGKPLVIHRDIKSSNVLFDSNGNAKLADFGLAVLQPDSLSPASPPAGTIGYLDPSYTNPSKLSTKNDIFSFGVVLLEIISSRNAIDVYKTPSSIVEWAVPLIKDQLFDEILDSRITLPAYMSPMIVNFLRMAARCVSPEEDDRPSIGEVVMKMDSCFITRVRFPIWTSVLRRMARLRKRRKVGSEEGKVADGGSMAGGKLLLREVLADVRLS